jgi:hypothetical protein
MPTCHKIKKWPVHFDNCTHPQKSGTQPQPVHNLIPGSWFVLFWHCFCLPKTSVGKLVCVASQYGGSLVYLQAHIWYNRTGCGWVPDFWGCVQLSKCTGHFFILWHVGMYSCHIMQCIRHLGPFLEVYVSKCCWSWFVLFWHCFCLPKTSVGKLVCVASQYGGSLVYLQAHIWYNLWALSCRHVFLSYYAMYSTFGSLFGSLCE